MSLETEKKTSPESGRKKQATIVGKESCVFYVNNPSLVWDFGNASEIQFRCDSYLGKEIVSAGNWENGAE